MKHPTTKKMDTILNVKIITVHRKIKISINPAKKGTQVLNANTECDILADFT